jgi:hypothetical protein
MGCASKLSGRVRSYRSLKTMKTLLAVFLSGLVLCWGTVQADERPQVTVTIINHTTSGYIKQGCVGLTVITSGGFAGTFAGSVSLAASTTYPIPIPSGARLNDTYYTVTGGTLTTIEVR